MWRDLFPKVMKWCVSSFCVIWGVAGLLMVNEGHMGALLPAIFSFGIVYWQYKTRSELPKPVLLASVVVLGAAFAATLYVPLMTFPFDKGFFPALSAWTIMIGAPVIAWAYAHAD